MTFNIIHHRGDPKQARTLHDYQVTRQQQLLVREWNMFVPCAPYDDHFIYATDPTIPDIPSYMCTCGAAAIVLNPRTPNALFVCVNHHNVGVHQTGGKRWV